MCWLTTVKPVKTGHPRDHEKRPVSTVNRFGQVFVGSHKKNWEDDDRRQVMHRTI